MGLENADEEGVTPNPELERDSDDRPECPRCEGGLLRYAYRTGAVYECDRCGALFDARLNPVERVTETD